MLGIGIKRYLRELSVRNNYITKMLGNPSFFNKFLEDVDKNQGILHTIKQAELNYNIKAYNISEITCDEALKLYNSIYAKFYKNTNHMKCSNWFENQLRLFVWIVICYTHLKNKKLEDLDSEDWAYFQKIFDRKDPKLFQYQCHCFYLENKGKNWEREQQNLLKKIMDGQATKTSKVKWNQISKQLFHFSNKQFLRTPKQCRERWNNHLDPSKVKGMWKRDQYIKMFEFVRQHGKKWASLVKQLSNTRNEHSIKNKFNSMVKRHKKSIGQKGSKQPKTQQQLYTEIIDKVRSAINNQKNCKSRNQIEFELDDYEQVKQPRRVAAFDKKTSNYAEKLMQKLMHFGGSNQPAKKKEVVKSQTDRFQKTEPLKIEQQKNSFLNSADQSYGQQSEDENESYQDEEMDNEEDLSEKQADKILEKLSNQSLNNMHRNLQNQEYSVRLETRIIIPEQDKRKNSNEQAPTSKSLPIDMVNELPSAQFSGSCQIGGQ